MKNIFDDVKDFLFCMMFLAVGVLAGRLLEKKENETKMENRMVISMPMDAKELIKVGAE